jgi:hypothetical protein
MPLPPVWAGASATADELALVAVVRAYVNGEA